MGVTVLQQYPVPENKTGTYVIDLLTKRLLALGATQQGQFLVDCESYLSLPQMGPTKTVHVLHNSEQPASVFSILESGSKNIHVVADSLFDLLMMKLSNIYTSKKQTKMESKGTRFELGDFCVKLGSVTMNQSFKGVLVEVLAVELDVIDCGIDHELDVTEGDVEISQYPWLGVLYYSYYSGDSEARAVTTVALIQAEFVIAPAADIGPMPKLDFRENSRVLLGERWGAGGRRVRNFVLHPEYGDTCNTVALVQLRSPVRNLNIRPLCPPPERLRNPEFYVVKFKEGDDYNILQKQVVPVTHVPPSLCREFYLRANLYAKKMRPPHVACAVSLEDNVCVWDAGAALVARDVWGRWQLLGMSVRGPGCGAPSRYLDMMSYYPWVASSLSRFRRISISKISKQKYIVRTGHHAYQKFGNCDEGEKINLVFREMIVLRTDNTQYQFLTYNLTVYDNVEFSCLTLELLNASAVSEMRIHHHCVRRGFGVPCYRYKGSVFEISVYLMFSETCRFEMFAWGWKKNMTLLDIQEWKWEEGTYYEDFTAREVEYRGPTHQTLYGFEPLDESMWVPEYDVWSTTPPPDPNATTTTRRVRSEHEVPKFEKTTEGKDRLQAPKDTLPPPTPPLYMTGKPNPKKNYQALTTRAHGKALYTPRPGEHFWSRI